MIIYKATNKINKKVYVGQTIHTLEYRRKQHENRSKYDKYLTLFGRALRKYGFENFEWKIICRANSKRELDILESLWILVLHSTEKERGYNLKLGGDQPCLTNSVKKKISEAQKGELNHMYGRRGKNNPCSIPVMNVTKNIKYDSATQCAEIEQISVSKVCAVCRGERATTNNCVYRYLIDNKIQEIDSKIHKKTIAVVNLNTEEYFESIRDAFKKYDPDATFDSLSQALKRGNGSCIWKGYKWKYASLDITEKEIVKKVRSDAKKVKNVTTGVIYESITSVGPNYRNLATALRKGEGKCYYQKQYWEIIN